MKLVKDTDNNQDFKKVSDKVSEGKFGAFMEIMIKNSGPVTFNFSI